MNCDPIARWYRWLEYIGFGRALERRRVAFLQDVKDAQRALVLGDGDGRFLVRLVDQNLRQHPGWAIDYVDVSGRMLELARARAGEQGVTYHQADALTMPLPEGEYDLIVTHFFLDCFDERDAQALVEKVARSARSDARWLISEFRETSWWSRWMLRGLYLFFRITTGLETRRLVDHWPLLKREGFRLQKQEPGVFGSVSSELWVRGLF
ncbi:MAG TPA: class I SAM-dependent methyltransferase [Bryobacteraceae bacterium]|nr:class I SAM-dependent methyltransferase [Bryobacteraceae bacterium]